MEVIVSFGISILNSFEGLGFKSYKEKDAKSADRVVVQINSLLKIVDTPNEVSELRFNYHGRGGHLIKSFWG